MRRRSSSRTVRLGLIAATAGAVAVGATVLPGSASAAGSVTMAGSRPGFVAQAHDAGAVAGSTAVDFKVLLALPDQAAAEAAVQAMSTPGSAQFRHFLTTAQFRDRFAATPATVSAVSSWVRSAGLHVASVAPSRQYVEVTGTAAQAQRLVGTSLHRYSYQGRTMSAPTGDYQLPANLAGKVSAIVDLDQGAQLFHPADTLPGPPAGVRYGVQPCGRYFGEKVATDKPAYYGKHWPYAVCGYYGRQLESAYGLAGAIGRGNDGRGVTVAITDAYASPTMASDAQTWSAMHALPKFKAGQYKELRPKSYTLTKECGAQGWYGEETLDVEAVHSMAPGANVLYVGGSNCADGLNNAWAQTIDQKRAPIITNSWGEAGENISAGERNFFHQYLVQAAATGISVLFSSGDSGDDVAATGKKQVDAPVNDPYATAVGGTTTEIGADGKIVFQHGWSNAYGQLKGNTWTKPAYSSGAGGGTSRIYAQPAYQKGHVPDSISKYFGGGAKRAVPDISMPGDANTGLRIGETQTFPNGTYYSEYRLGGTSLSSPLMAGVLALAVQYNKAPVGFINPLVYANQGKAAMTDVLPPSSPTAAVRTDYANLLNGSAGLKFQLQTIDFPTTIATRKGYDDVTGIGTPNGDSFLKAMHH